MSKTTDPIRELIAAVGAIAKREVLSKHKDNAEFLMFLQYALDPLKTYNISESTIRKYAASALEEIVEYGVPPEDPEDNIYRWCDILLSRNGVSNIIAANLARCLYSRYDEEDRELYIKMLSKTLRLGVTAATVNKVIPNLIDKWEVQQAFPIEKYPIQIGTEFWVTQKLNGVRATYYKGKLIARSGQPFEGLDHIIGDLDEYFQGDAVLDGELTLRRVDQYAGLSDNEAFRTATGIINGDDDSQKVYIMYTIFDIVPIDDFDGITDPKHMEPYSVRRAILDDTRKTMKMLRWEKSFEILPVLYYGVDQSQISLLLDKMVAEDKEGLMINLDVPYQRKRHRGILKVKRFYTMDLPIIRCEEGRGRLEGTLGNLVVDFCGNEVCVGSGFSDQQRDEFWAHADDLVDVLCEVKYKEISSDKKTGARSLQFPVFVGLRTDKTEVSYG